MSARISRNGVCYDLRKTPYVSVLDYEGERLQFAFSSELYKSMFESRYKDNRKKINESLSNRFGIDIELEKIPDVKLYATVEKRGFLIRIDDEVLTCLEEIRLNGENLTIKN